jgi:hypothetical protein
MMFERKRLSIARLQKLIHFAKVHVYDKFKKAES